MRNKDYKVARTAVYSVLFGKQQHTYIDKKVRPKRRSNVPEYDETRELSHFWEYSAAKSVFDSFIGDCRFTKERVEFLTQRLETLKAAKRKQQPAE